MWSHNLCFFSPLTIFRNSSCGMPSSNLFRPPNTSSTSCASCTARCGRRISALICSKLCPFRWSPNRSSTSASTKPRNRSLSSGFVSNTRFTNPVRSSSAQVMRLLMISASLVLLMPSRCTKASDALPSATSPSELNGVSRKAWGAA